MLDKKQKVPATHLEVRKALLQIQKLGGGMLMPFPLFEIAEKVFPYKLLSYHRTIVQVFCALCNEYFLIYCYDKKPKTKFFVSEDRWEKYHIDRHTRETVIEDLSNIGWIFTETTPLPDKEDIKITTYEINSEMLNLFVRYAGEERDLKRARKIPF